MSEEGYPALSVEKCSTEGCLADKGIAQYKETDRFYCRQHYQETQVMEAPEERPPCLLRFSLPRSSVQAATDRGLPLLRSGALSQLSELGAAGDKSVTQEKRPYSQPRRT